MSTPPKSAVFLERSSYRQRRLIDAVRLLPVLGVILIALPLLWRTDETAVSINADALIYVFGVWVFLIGCSAFIGTRLRDEDAASQSDLPD